jgi:hypothetical protein
MREVLEAVVPNPAAALWIGILIAFLLFGDAAALRSRKNLALAGVLLLAPALLHVMELGRSGRGTAAPIFTVLFLLTAGYAAWSFVLSRGRGIPDWRPNLSRAGLKALLVFVLALDVAVVLGRRPDDAGIYSNLGARRWAETGTIPYADPKLKGPNAPAFGAAATYGPLLYLAHLPFQLVLRVPVNPPDAMPRDGARKDAVPAGPSYRWPTALATKLACLTFLLAGLAGLFVSVRRLAGEDAALAAVILYAGSPYVLGLGGEEHVIGGLAFISHIAPSAVLLLAFAALNRPILSGVLMACAAGVLFWPAFLFPLWLGWRAWRREGALRFAAGFALTGLAIAALVVYYSHSPPISAIRLFLESTLEHQEGAGALEYGASTFSFWGTHPALAAVLQQPLFGTTSLFKPMFLAFVALCLAAAFWARGRTVPQFAALTAMLAAAIQLWKTHATGSYVEWYLPFLIIALLGAAASGSRGEPENPSPAPRPSEP